LAASLWHSQVAKDLIVSLRCKQAENVFGVQLDKEADVFCNNQGIVKNASTSESTLMKKHNLTSRCEKQQRVGKKDRTPNLVDPLTKATTSERQKELHQCVMCQERRLMAETRVVEEDIGEKASGTLQLRVFPMVEFFP